MFLRIWVQTLSVRLVCRTSRRDANFRGSSHREPPSVIIRIIKGWKYTNPLMQEWECLHIFANITAESESRTGSFQTDWSLVLRRCDTGVVYHQHVVLLMSFSFVNLLKNSSTTVQLVSCCFIGTRAAKLQEGRLVESHILSFNAPQSRG